MTSDIIPRDLALLGAGYWGKNLARNFQALGALHTICDAQSAALRQYSDGYANVSKTVSVEKVLLENAITKVAIAAPATLHFQLAKAALLAGKDVYVEKPLCLEETEAIHLVDLAQQRGRILMVGHLLQYHPCIVKIRELLLRGELGKLYYIISNRLNLGKIRQEENALWSFAPHDLSVILSLTANKMPEQVRCVGGSYLNGAVADTTLTTMKFPDAIRAHIYVSWLNPFKEQKLTVVGSNGMVVFDDTRPWKEKLLLHRDYLTWTDGQLPMPSKTPAELVLVEEQEPLRNECAHFLHCCRTRETPRTDGGEGLRVLRVLHMAQTSLDHDGQAVYLDPSKNEKVGISKSEGGTTDCRLSVPSFLAHATAVVDEGSIIGKGTKIWHFSHIMKGAQIGEGCVLGQNVNVDGGTVIGNNVKVQNNVSIYTGTEIEDDVFLGPSCVLTNVTNPRAQINRHRLYEKTIIRRGATIGANATIVCGITLGKYCFVAAGAVVTRNVRDYALMVGNPARQIGWMSRHGHHLVSGLDNILTCPESGLRYKENQAGVLSCLDLPEDSPLPSEGSIGTRSYREFKRSV
jgi:UDP-2-acetamido-3-amino-2,3-dideoxy-glucuronate N-acetyltransferase